MLKYFLIPVTILSLLSCVDSNTKNQSNKPAVKMQSPIQDQKMDSILFWKIIDYAFAKGEFNNEVKEQAILEQLVKLSPQQIQLFEIIFQQMNMKASTWGTYAAQVAIEGSSSDDRYYYFRCWLISLGQRNFEETVKNPDYLASLDIPFNKKNGMMYCQFEELIPMADRAYEIVTKKDPTTDTTFPRPHADNLGLFYDSNTPMTGIEWDSIDELPEIVPLLCKKYPDE